MIRSNLIKLTPDLGELFTLYWVQVMPPDQRGNIALPFFHLRKDSFWHLVPRPGKETILNAIRQIRSIHHLRDTIVGAQLDPKLYEMLGNEEFRHRLRVGLIEAYFAPELHSALLEQGVINAEAFRYSQELVEHALTPKIKEGLIDQEHLYHSLKFPPPVLLNQIQLHVELPMAIALVESSLATLQTGL